VGVFRHSARELALARIAPRLSVGFTERHLRRAPKPPTRPRGCVRCVHCVRLPGWGGGCRFAHARRHTPTHAPSHAPAPPRRFPLPSPAPYIFSLYKVRKKLPVRETAQRARTPARGDPPPHLRQRTQRTQATLLLPSLQARHERHVVAAPVPERPGTEAGRSGHRGVARAQVSRRPIFPAGRAKSRFDRTRCAPPRGRHTGMLFCGAVNIITGYLPWNSRPSNAPFWTGSLIGQAMRALARQIAAATPVSPRVHWNRLVHRVARRERQGRDADTRDRVRARH
jgi:hypothetical protein